MTQSGCQLLGERVLHLALLVLEELCDVVHHKHRHEFFVSLYSFDLNLENFGKVSVFHYFVHIFDFRISVEKHRHHTKIALVVTKTPG